MCYALLLQVSCYPLPQFVYWVSRKDVLCPAVVGKPIDILCPNLYINCAERMFYALPLQVNGSPLPQFVYWVSRKDVLCPAVEGRLIFSAPICLGVQRGGD
jgi:hypothetical protein